MLKNNLFNLDIGLIRRFANILDGLSIVDLKLLKINSADVLDQLGRITTWTKEQVDFSSFFCFVVVPFLLLIYIVTIPMMFSDDPIDFIISVTHKKFNSLFYEHYENSGLVIFSIW